MTPQVALPGVEAYREAFESIRASLPGERGAAFETFAAKGFPTNRVEAWKYTSLRPLARQRFQPAAPDPEAAVPFLGEGPRIVLVNGFLREDLSTVPVERWTGPDGMAEADGEPLVALNAAMAGDGYMLDIEDTRGEPIEIIHATVPGRTGPVAQSRNRIVVGSGGAAHVIERHIGLGAGAYFVNGVTEVEVEAGGRLRHTKLQEEGADAHHLWFMPARLGRGASLESTVFTFGARLSRNQIEADIAGEGAQLALNGAYAIAGRQLADHTSRIEHHAPGATSRQVYKGAIGGQARGVFQGHIVVAEGAQKTDGHQLNRALLLSGRAEIDAKPVLEIYADDVQCSHGATAGDIDGDALFYLRSRGIPADTARGLLVRAFLSEILEDTPEGALRTAVEERIDGFLEAGA